MKTVLGILIAFVLTIFIIIGYVWSAYTTAGKQDNGIIAIYENLQNVYANSIIETLEQKNKILNKSHKDLKEIIKLNMLRYANDKNLMFKSIVESAGIQQNKELYKDMSDSIESAYLKFENTNKNKIDRVRSYKTFLDYSFKGNVAKMFGFPSKKAKFIMNQMILNEKTNKTFETGIMQRPNLD